MCFFSYAFPQHSWLFPMLFRKKYVFVSHVFAPNSWCFYVFPHVFPMFFPCLSWFFLCFPGFFPTLSPEFFPGVVPGAPRRFVAATWTEAERLVTGDWVNYNDLTVLPNPGIMV